MYFWAAWRIFSRSMDDNSSVAVGEFGGRAETIRSAKSYELSRVWSSRVGGFARPVRSRGDWGAVVWHLGPQPQVLRPLVFSCGGVCAGRLRAARCGRDA